MNEKNRNEEKKSMEKFEPAKLDKVELSKKERKNVAGGRCDPINYSCSDYCPPDDECCEDPCTNVSCVYDAE